jgi:hypothetical protein
MCLAAVARFVDRIVQTLFLRHLALARHVHWAAPTFRRLGYVAITSITLPVHHEPVKR